MRETTRGEPIEAGEDQIDVGTYYRSEDVEEASWPSPNLGPQSCGKLKRHAHDDTRLAKNWLTNHFFIILLDP